MVAQQVAAGTDKFLLLAIPFFFLAAEFMSSGGVMQRLVDFARALVGHLRGGLGQMNVVAQHVLRRRERLGGGRRRRPRAARDRDHAPRGLPARLLGGDHRRVGDDRADHPAEHPARRLRQHRQRLGRAAVPRRLRARPADGPVPDGRGVVARRPAQLPAQPSGSAAARSRAARAVGAGADAAGDHPRRHLQRRLHPDGVGDRRRRLRARHRARAARAEAPRRARDPRQGRRRHVAHHADRRDGVALQLDPRARRAAGSRSPRSSSVSAPSPGCSSRS